MDHLRPNNENEQGQRAQQISPEEKHVENLFQILVASYEIVSDWNPNIIISTNWKFPFSKVRNTILMSTVFSAVYQRSVSVNLTVKLFLGVLFVLWLSTFLLMYGVVKRSCTCVLIFLCIFEAHSLMVFIRYMLLPESTEELEDEPEFDATSLLLTIDFLSYVDLKTFNWKLSELRKPHPVKFTYIYENQET